MSDSNSLFGPPGLAAKSIIAHTTGGVLNKSQMFRAFRALDNQYVLGPVNRLSGACTAGVLRTILSVTGPGCISYLGYEAIDATIRAHRIKLTLDGNVVFDATTASTADILSAVTEVIGSVSPFSVTGSDYWGGWQEMPVMFNASLLLEYASSLTETDKCRLGTIHYLR
jgi:hypothetical protein